MQAISLISDYRIRLAHELIDKCERGSSVHFFPPNRTDAQNRKMWPMLSDVARAKPQGRVHPAEHWKCLFMAEIGEQPLWLPSLDGLSVVNVGYRSSRLTVAKMSDIIECINAYAAEHEIPMKD